jgi:HEAT repeat protein
MNLDEIQLSLGSDDPQVRMRGLTALRLIEPEIAAPILIKQIEDGEMIVRSFVVLGLGYKRSDDGFMTLLRVMDEDADPNIRAEAAGALAKFGAVSVPHLVNHFYQDQHWLSQMTVVLCLPDLDCPKEFLEVACKAANSTESAIRSTAIEQLPSLLATPYEAEALQELLNHVQDEDWNVRRNVALALRSFDHDVARQALQQLRQDSQYQVVAATLEGLLNTSS